MTTKVKVTAYNPCRVTVTCIPIDDEHKHSVTDYLMMDGDTKEFTVTLEQSVEVVEMDVKRV